jgi:serine/threonine-protein kinase
MGEGYRARDTKLGREVALKVLPPEFAKDSERLARFQREAQVLASLNHPNIAIIHGLEDADGTPALVLELVEGPTLADRIADGPIPVDEAVRVARQVAAALEAAHDHGIIHRDLKPSNIQITPAGVVKVLDFGLAKLVEGPAQAGHYVQGGGGVGGRSVRLQPDLTASPTITSPAMMTRAGMILGTAAYMAPEQARGKVVDKRADIWAFGCVLYEMLTGKRPFEGSNVSDTLASVLKLDPDWAALPADTPPALRRVMRRTLQKDPAQRLHDIADARLELDDALHEPDAMSVVASRRASGGRAAILGAAIVATTALSAGIVWWVLTPEPPAVQRFSIAIDPAAPLSEENDPNMAISPDGSRLVYVTRQQGGTDSNSFMLRQFDQLHAVPIAGTEAGHSPFFSPDGQWVAFFADADGTLKKVSLAGGPAVTISKAPSPHLGASWATDDTIVFAGPGLSRVSAAGGTPAVITTPDPKRNETHAFPDVLPNNRGVLFTAGVDNASRIEVLRFDTGERQIVIENASVARYVPTGHVVYSQVDRLFAVPFDQEQLLVTGPAVPVLDGVSVTSDGPATFSFSRDGSLVYLPGSVTGDDRTLVWVDLKGGEAPLTAKPRPYSWVRVSPDGNRLAMEVDDSENTDIWIHDLVRNTQTRLTFDPGPDRFPTWTPDGRRVVFVSGTDLLAKSADGTGEVERLASGMNLPVPYAWSQDGKNLLLQMGQPSDIYVLSLGSDAKPQPLIQTPFAESRPAISPDGRWIAYTSSFEVYVQPFPEVNGGRWQISTDRGDSPFWSPDGRRLFYRRPGAVGVEGAMMAVTVESGQAFAPGTPSVLFEGRYDFVNGRTGFTGNARGWDIAPDGQRFLMLKQETLENNPVANIVVVQHWFEELKRLVPSP